MYHAQLEAEIRRLEREVSATVRERDEARKWHNEVKEDNASLRARLAEAEAQLCRAREALQGMENISNLWIPSIADEEHRGRQMILDALEKSSPCPHEAEVERLDKANGLLCKVLNEISMPGQPETIDRALKIMDVVILGTEIDRLRDRVAELEKALEAARATVGCPNCYVCSDRVAAALRDLDAALKERFKAPVVCICGSTRFKQAWIAENARLTGEGNIVLAVGLWGHHERVFPDAETKARLDELHLRKIDLCDWVWVLDIGGYIGESTRNEIAYAEAHGKPVRYLSKEFPDYVELGDPMIALMKVAVVAERYLHGLLLEEETTTVELRETLSEWRNTPMSNITEFSTGSEYPFISFDTEGYSREQAASLYQKAIRGEVLTTKESAVVGAWCVHPLNGPLELAPHVIGSILRASMEAPRAEVSALKEILRLHRRFHSKVSCPGVKNCYVCEAEESLLDKEADRGPDKG